VIKTEYEEGLLLNAINQKLDYLIGKLQEAEDKAKGKTDAKPVR